MPEEIEIETKELQETIEELHEERRERAEAERQNAWTRYIALTTAILAVFAAIGALQSGTLVNEAMIKQLKASDTWSEYQAARQKEHLYSIQANGLLDRGVSPPADSPGRGADTGRAHAGRAGLTSAAAVQEKPAAESKGGGASEDGKARAGGRKGAENSAGKGSEGKQWRSAPPDERLRAYISQVEKEAGKEESLKEKAEELERESAHEMHQHHQFAESVAFIQVAIALSAVAALTRIKSVWALSLVVGLIGLGLFAIGLLPH